MMKSSSISLRVRRFFLSFILIIIVRASCVTIWGSHSSTMPKFSVPRNECITYLCLVLQKSIIFTLLFFCHYYMTYPDCDEPSLFPLNDPSEKISN